MAFYQEPDHYEKIIVSDLQGVWEILREAIIQEHEIRDCSLLLFHVNEAMSWESVRNLEHMKDTLVLIQSIAQQKCVSARITELIEDVRDILYETLNERVGPSVRGSTWPFYVGPPASAQPICQKIMSN